MSMQIRSITLYHADGDTRTLRFKPGAVNIITGTSKTGKTALINIIEYCLGRSKFEVPEGVIRDTVAWYAVLYQVNDRQVFIAKPTPKSTKSSQHLAHYEVGTEIPTPRLDQLSATVTNDEIVTSLSQLIGISTEATIVDASYYLFQRHNVITNPEILFHRQSNNQVAKRIKETLPYFLGAIREDDFRVKKEYDHARRVHRQAVRKRDEAKTKAQENMRLAQKLVIEAQQAGLISGEFMSDDMDTILETLRSMRTWQEKSFPTIEHNNIQPLQREITELRKELRQKQEQITSAERYMKGEEGYTNEANYQVMRLESINLFTNTDNKRHICPLCSSVMEQPIPSVTEMKRDLEQLETYVVHVTRREQPQLHKHIQGLQEECDVLTQQITERRRVLDAAIQEQESARLVRDENARNGGIISNIRFYLDDINPGNDHMSSLENEVEQAERRVRYYEEQLNSGEDQETMLDYMLRRLGHRMSDLAEKLQLDYGNIYHLDIKNLTVIADEQERPVSMERMGSQANWLASHVITHLALHEHFIQNQRPVPGFLFLDQPMQVYVPSEETTYAAEGTRADIPNPDLDAARHLFNLLFDVCKKLAPDFQIIITEHANSLFAQNLTAKNKLLPHFTDKNNPKNPIVPHLVKSEEQNQPKQPKICSYTWFLSPH